MSCVPFNEQGQPIIPACPSIFGPIAAGNLSWYLAHHLPTLAAEYRRACEAYMLTLDGWQFRMGYRIFPDAPHQRRSEFGSRLSNGGKCNLCGELILKADGTPAVARTWHPQCGDIYWSIYNWQQTTLLVTKLAGGKCALCERDGDEVDHERELFDHQGDITAHFLSNLRLLCHECHGRKSGASRAARNRRAHPQQQLLLEPMGQPAAIHTTGGSAA